VELINCDLFVFFFYFFRNFSLGGVGLKTYPMSNLYENIDGQEELDFPLLFLYNQPGGDLPQDDQG